MSVALCNSDRYQCQRLVTKAARMSRLSKGKTRKMDSRIVDDLKKLDTDDDMLPYSDKGGLKSKMGFL